jgi:hypothetical protein
VLTRSGSALKIVTEGSLGREWDWDCLSVDEKAAAFAAEHGSFSLLFDSGQGYIRPDDAPWTLELDPPVIRADGCTGWMGFTAGEALDFAASDLAGITRAPANERHMAGS